MTIAFGPWPGVPTGTGSGTQDWFLDRLARARQLMPGAGFDTIIPMEFGETVTAELADPVGVAEASPQLFAQAGVVQVDVGDAAIALSSGRLQLVGSTSHIAELAAGPWYSASLGKYVGPRDGAFIADTSVDMIGVWWDDDNRAMLGIRGNASGGSTTNWVGSARNAATEANVIGPSLDGESSLWHLFEMWFNPPNVFFGIDGALFTGIQTPDLPAVPARLAMISLRSAVDPILLARTQYDKACVIVASPAPGSS